MLQSSARVENVRIQIKIALQILNYRMLTVLERDGYYAQMEVVLQQNKHVPLPMGASQDSSVVMVNVLSLNVQ